MVATLLGDLVGFDTEVERVEVVLLCLEVVGNLDEALDGLLGLGLGVLLYHLEQVGQFLQELHVFGHEHADGVELVALVALGGDAAEVFVVADLEHLVVGLDLAVLEEAEAEGLGELLQGALGFGEFDFIRLRLLVRVVLFLEAEALGLGLHAPQQEGPTAALFLRFDGSFLN